MEIERKSGKLNIKSIANIAPFSNMLHSIYNSPNSPKPYQKKLSSWYFSNDCTASIAKNDSDSSSTCKNHATHSKKLKSTSIVSRFTLGGGSMLDIYFF